MSRLGDTVRFFNEYERFIPEEEKRGFVEELLLTVYGMAVIDVADTMESLFGFEPTEEEYE
jgi:hypothetical protein